jgi:hypothetical protein
MVKRVDFSDDILDYLRQRRGKLVGPLQMVQDLTKRVKERDKSRLRGALLSDLARLVREEKVVRYRRKPFVKKKGSSTQGLIRISEIFV